MALMFGRRVGMGDGDSGWCSVRLLGRPWTDVLSRAARVWIRVRLSREASAVGRSGLGRMRVRAGYGPRSVGALVRGRIRFTLETVTRSNCLLRLTDGR
ncbi:hypothetical protein DPMN_188372 [Dreissena polymorpha]|uniref:Uncharacterized protein n=1 Tax=Dreissena polymorpha TaxID=45954 RepID=A0A9D4I9Z4_DREPO|nr:hypothetical protein DPMN_188372 [Dreissena polymorpha]